VTRRPLAPWSHLRLRDCIEPGVRVLFVGINPGVRSAVTGHHFAGYSNRFWKLLFESGLIPAAITSRDDRRLPEWGFGITNLIARPSPGIDSLSRPEYVDGWKALSAKVRRYRPEFLAFVGVSLYRALLPLLDPDGHRSRVPSSPLGLQPYLVHQAQVFVLPNPSGRNANYSYAEMLAAYKELERFINASRTGLPRTRHRGGRGGRGG
jgi:TDG/mug DNA glycosylase family protein